MAVSSPHVLACGRTVESLWDQLESGRSVPDTHQGGCPHCTTARASLEQLVEATGQLVEDPARPASGLLDRIMSAVRADLVHGESMTLPTPLGGADVSMNALRGVLRFAVDTVDGVRSRRCRVVPVADRPGAVRVWMSLSLRFGSYQVETLAEARRRAMAALSDRVGVTADAVDFEIDDVFLDHPPGDAGATADPTGPEDQL